MNSLRSSFLICCLGLLVPLVPLVAEDNGRKIPGSASEIEGQMDQEFGQEIAPETKFSELLKSSEISLKLRNYYLNRGKPNANDPIGWAQGGILSHKMGRVGGVFSMNTELMGSYRLYAPDDHSGHLLLDNEQNSITTLGVLNPRLTAEGTVLSLYRQRYNLPFVNEQDNRMLPNTFEGYTIGQPISTSKKFQYILGYIDRIKKRDTGNFVSMSDAAGVTQTDQGMFLGGARGYFTPDWSLAAIDYYVEDVLNIAYAETIYKSKISEEVENTASVQYASQSSVGDNLLLGKDFSTSFWGFQDAASYKGFVFKVAVTANDDSADIRSPYGSYPGYNSVIVQDFNKAGETSWQVGLSYDLGKVGMDGFKVSAAYVQGDGALSESTGARIGDERETDFTIDYRPTEGPLKNFWLRLRSATIKDEDIGTTQDFRVIVNYDVLLFGPDNKSKV